MVDADDLELHDFEPERERFRAEVLQGLQSARKRLPCKYFYDGRGSQLFERICELEEYYLTRTELDIMQQHAGDMAAAIGPRCLLVEYGSGSSRKTQLLLDRLEEPAGYVPVDIARDPLLTAAEGIAKRYPELPVLPVCADFTDGFALPASAPRARRTLVYFPGSTIGNFDHDAAREFLARAAALGGARGGLLIGIDLDKDPALLERAYDDARGVTAEFNRNLLRRINRELDGEFDPASFAHQARYVANAQRVEMHLVSLREQAVRVDGVVVRFARGESIHTESSHKYTPEGFAALAADAGLRVERTWTDDERRFAVVLLAAR